MTNYVFAFYMMNILYEVVKTPQLSKEVFLQYDGAATFNADMHYIFIQAHADPKHQWFKLPYIVTEADIKTVVQHWPTEWLKDVGKKPHIPVPIVTNVGAGPSNTQQQAPLEDSEEQTESQQNDSNHGNEMDIDEDEGKDSVETTPEPNRKDKRKSPEVEEVDRPRS